MSSRTRQIPSFGLDLESSAADEMVGGKPLEVNEPIFLSLEEPRDYQVFQRRSLREGALRLNGRVPPGTDEVEVRLTGELPAGNAAGEWSPIDFDAGSGIFRQECKAPAGGWYACEVRALKKGNLVGTVTVPHVGVGEVFVVAGQSNSSNHGSESSNPGPVRWLLSMERTGASPMIRNQAPAAAGAVSSRALAMFWWPGLECQSALPQWARAPPASGNGCLEANE